MSNYADNWGRQNAHPNESAQDIKNRTGFSDSQAEAAAAARAQAQAQQNQNGGNKS